MAKFEAKAFNANSINNGNKYVNGDGISADAINAPIEAAMLMQSLALNQPDISKAHLVGEPSVSIVFDENRKNPKFAFSHLKGEHGKDHTEDIQRIDASLSATSILSIKNADYISVLQKQTKNIEAALKDSAYIFDNDIAYKKIVPENVAPFAFLDVIGGHTIKEGNSLKHAAVTNIARDGISLFSIPSSVQSENGYGMGIDNNYYNRIEYNDDNTVSFAKSAELLVLDATLPANRVYAAKENRVGHIVFVITIQKLSANQKSVINMDIPYEYRYAGDYPHYYTEGNQFVIILPDTAAQTAEEFVSYISNNPIQCLYPLVAEERKDITDKMPIDNMISVVSGQELIAVNQNGIPAATSVIYQKKGLVG